MEGAGREGEERGRKRRNRRLVRLVWCRGAVVPCVCEDLCVMLSNVMLILPFSPSLPLSPASPASDGKMTGERKHKVRGGKDLTPEERQVRFSFNSV